MIQKVGECLYIYAACIHIRVPKRIIIIITNLEGILSFKFQGVRQPLSEIPTKEWIITFCLFLLFCFSQLKLLIKYCTLPNH